MTDPPAWPEADEDVLKNCRDAFEDVSKTLGAHLDSAKQERTQIFGGVGIWSGGGANAASSSLDKRIADLESVKERLEGSAKLFSNSATAVVGAKDQIINNVEAANKILDWVRDHPDIAGDEKEAAIRAGVAAMRAANIEVVETAGSGISGHPPAAPESPNAPSGDGVQYFGPNGPKEEPVIPASNGVPGRRPD